ncbi:2-methylcitrate dehydratase PrpD [Actinoplanes lutulentus]|uniref:2-methylcitrate dehydratase PrpD n=1 Tax=Actinoplanes lutulentus TaxID=1287878 RepID=A0A327ZK23_9ACTN|nr:MmgE/PrpD family protein [Actinoplanes lutulentus]MBB2944422.1 2-methylcitrate dehydratase PrpD [Actinoplanes lutulentus]RAK42346.1 2-methylcitrate dehydratase PrpD [Actinoplanes lutulentus]
MTLAHDLGEFAATIDPPARVRDDVPTRILDVLGNALAAYAEEGADAGPAAIRAMRRWGGVAESTVLGYGDRLPAPNAAFVNGTLAHSLDYDDTHLPSVLHPSASVVPAALAAAEAGAPGDLIAAIAAGIEVTNRLGMAGCDPETGANLYFERGQHATSICGTIGAAVAVARLYELDAGRIADAVGIAVSMGAGVLEANRTGGSVKRTHCGWAAHGGVVAATLAAEGLTGPPTVLEGRFGFFTAHTGRFDASAVTDGLGERWELLRTVFKPYPSNHFTHAGIDGALALIAAGLDPDDIAEIELGVAEPVLRTIAEPAAEKARPRTGYHAKFSGPYTLAIALTGGTGLGVGLDDFAGLDARRLELAAKVRVVADPAATAAFPRAFAGVLRVCTKAGVLLEHRVDSSRGGPGHPLSPAEVVSKFTGNATRAISVDAARALSDAVWALGSGGPVSALFPTRETVFRDAK